MTGDGYVEIYSVIDGTQGDEEFIPCGPDTARAVQDFLETARQASAEASVTIEVFTIDHPHANEGDECACVQYLTDHHPDFTYANGARV